MKRSILVGLLGMLVWVLAACGEEGHQATNHATFQACFDVHAEDEMLSAVDAILSCCGEHPIGGLRGACGTTAPDCINYLTANLKQTSASTTEVMDACAAYAEQL